METKEIKAMAEIVNYKNFKARESKDHMEEWKLIYGANPSKFQNEKDRFEALQNTDEYLNEVFKLFDESCELLTLKERNVLARIIRLKYVTGDTDAQGRAIADYALGFVHGRECEGSNGERTLFYK